MQPSEIQRLITAHREQERALRGRWDKYLAWYRGEFATPTPEGVEGSDADVALETNYIYAYVDSLVASIVPANPEVSLTVWYPKLQPSRQARESLINTIFRTNNMHARLWRLASLTSLCGYAFLKAVWRPSRKTVRFKVLDPRRVWTDPDATTWEDNRYVIEAVPLTEAEFRKRAKRKVVRTKGGVETRPSAMYRPSVVAEASPQAFPTWLRPGAERGSSVMDAPEEVSSVFKWVLVYEVHDLVERRLYHVLPGHATPLLDEPLPYNFLPNPYYPLVFNDDLRSTRGLSDAALIERLQQMVNELDTMMLQSAQANIPIGVFDKNSVEDPTEFASQMAGASSPRDVVPLALKQGKTMRDVLTYTETPSLSGDHHRARASAVSAIEFILALPSYQRGIVGEAHIATEVAAAMEAMQTRMGRRVKAVHDTLSWAARATMALYEEFLASADSIPVATMSGDAQQISRVTLLAAAPGEGTRGYWDDSYFTYKVSPYNAPDQSKPAQLRSLGELLPLLTEMPEVQRGKLIAWLLEQLAVNPALILRSEEQLEALDQARLAMATGQGQAPPQGQPSPGGPPTPPGQAPLPRPQVEAGGPAVQPGGEVSGVDTSPAPMGAMTGGAGIGV
jgi:hypothetical protein